MSVNIISALRIATLAEQILLSDIGAGTYVRKANGNMDHEGTAITAVETAYRMLVHAEKLADGHNYADD